MKPEHKALIKTKEHKELMEAFEKYHGGNFGTAFTSFGKALLEHINKYYQPRSKGKKHAEPDLGGYQPEGEDKGGKPPKRP